MTPELYAIGIVFTLCSGLVGVIWKMLNDKMKSDHKTHQEALATQTRTLLDSIKSLESHVRAQINENNNQLSQRLTGNSGRIDSIISDISNHKVKLAEEYFSADETRRMIQDLTSPIREQLQEMKTMLIASLTNLKKGP